MRTTRALLSSLASVVFCSGVAIAVACGSSNSSNGSVDSGAGEEGGAGACVPGVAPANAACTPATNVVCNVVGQSVTCCPPSALFLCPTNNECYPTAAEAYAACGNVPGTCVACPVGVPDASTSDGASDDSPGTPDSGAPDTSMPDAGTSDASDAATSEDANDASVEDASDDAAD